MLPLFALWVLALPICILLTVAFAPCGCADKKMFQAEAEKRRALAVAKAAEHTADVEKNRALVVLAEADVPKAMAEALRNGNLGAMDWYRMQNIDSDTRMRSSIAGDSTNSSESGSES